MDSFQTSHFEQQTSVGFSPPLPNQVKQQSKKGYIHILQKSHDAGQYWKCWLLNWQNQPWQTFCDASRRSSAASHNSSRVIEMLWWIDGFISLQFKNQWTRLHNRAELMGAKFQHFNCSRSSMSTFIFLNASLEQRKQSNRLKGWRIIWRVCMFACCKGNSE